MHLLLGPEVQEGQLRLAGQEVQQVQQVQHRQQAQPAPLGPRRQRIPSSWNQEQHKSPVEKHGYSSWAGDLRRDDCQGCAIFPDSIPFPSGKTK